MLLGTTWSVWCCRSVLYSRFRVRCQGILQLTKEAQGKKTLNSRIERKHCRPCCGMLQPEKGHSIFYAHAHKDKKSKGIPSFRNKPANTYRKRINGSHEYGMRAWIMGPKTVGFGFLILILILFLILHFFFCFFFSSSPSYSFFVCNLQILW